MNVHRNTSDGSDSSNEPSESFSRLRLNNTPRPPSNDYLNDNHSPSNDRLNDTHRPHPNYRSNNTPSPFTHRSNNTRTKLNDNDNFIQSNTVARSTFDSNDNGVFRSNNNTSFRSESTPFHMMDDIHQVCSWLCKNPNVLLLAYNMYLSMQTPVVNEFNFISPNFNSSKISATAGPQEDRV